MQPSVYLYGILEYVLNTYSYIHTAKWPLIYSDHYACISDSLVSTPVDYEGDQNTTSKFILRIKTLPL